MPVHLPLKLVAASGILERLLKKGPSWAVASRYGSNATTSNLDRLQVRFSFFCHIALEPMQIQCGLGYDFSHLISLVPC